MDDGKTVGEVFSELFEELMASLADRLDQPTDNWTRYSVTFTEKLASDAPPWVGTDYTTHG